MVGDGAIQVVAAGAGDCRGAAWPDVFNPWRLPLLVVGFVPGLYLTWVWWKQ